MRRALPLAALAALTGLGGGTGAAAAQAPAACVVPRLYALAPAAAEARLTASGCRLGAIAYERPRSRVARVTGQVPAPGAVLARRARVALLVS
jgi:hypothetical protein